jgi:hypothetical protein
MCAREELKANRPHLEQWPGLQRYLDKMQGIVEHHLDLLAAFKAASAGSEKARKRSRG